MTGYMIMLFIGLIACGISYWLGQADAYNEAVKIELNKKTMERRLNENEWNKVKKD